MKKTEASQSLQKAIICIWICLGISILTSSMLFFISEPKTLESKLNPIGISYQTWKVYIAGFNTIAFFITYFIVYNLRKGRNWARITCLVFLLPLVLANLLHILKSILGHSHDLPDLIINSIRIWYGANAIYLIFSYPGRSMFKKLNTQVENETIV